MVIDAFNFVGMAQDKSHHSYCQKNNHKSLLVPQTPVPQNDAPGRIAVASLL